MKEIILTIRSAKPTEQLIRLLNQYGEGVEVTQEIRDVVSFKVPTNTKWDTVCEEEGLQFISIMDLSGNDLFYKGHGLFSKE